MDKFMVISDSFKGSLSSREICAVARECAARVCPEWEAVCVPVADGGEGTLECFREACGGMMVPAAVQGPFGEPAEAAWLRLPNGGAVVETAAAAGLSLAEGRENPALAGTYGVGQLIRAAVDGGCRTVTLGLGGSATNDAGCGCAAALGVRFLDEDGKPFVPVGATLDRIRKIDTAPAEELLRDVRLRAMCDVDNPLCGPSGAALVFAPQKGADPETARLLDGQLRAWDQAVRQNLNRSAAEVPGAGAAGGLGAGMMALLGAELCPGIEAVLDAVEFERLLRGCGLVFTGEGRLDSQSLRGKAVSGIARRVRACGVPTVVLAGSVAPEMEESAALRQLGVEAVFSINRQAEAFSRSRPHSRENYARTFENLLRLLKLNEK
ncbi:MAG: glycerate kinase [Oscillibacter sp.]|jgi:glycerate kinase|nr:glycerate kinase [Oscillibacter sp.]